MAQLKNAEKEILDKVSVEQIANDVYSITSIFTIGNPGLAPSIDHLEMGGRVVAVRITLWQNGGSHPNRDLQPPQKHYDSEELAARDGMDVNADVSWHVHSYYEYDGKTLTPLKIDLFEEGGFAWSGW